MPDRPALVRAPASPAARGPAGPLSEIQAKRTIAFAPGDAVLRDIAHQLGRAMATLDRSLLRHSFAVATDRTSAGVAGP